ncbi:MAG: 50S ribosomal protein L17 [Dehalococcoidia bacterium]|nr:50S ribosomal protein L17 [Dehalococcoidia bacterium]MDW8119372.1 50S ribosomal protein L17 [Chloroflexota bacterium]
MPHQVVTAKLGRPTEQRRAMLRNLVRSLFLHQRIQTTLPKARAASKLADRIITWALHAQKALDAGDTPENRAKALHYRRLALAALPDKDVVAQVFEQMPRRYRDRTSGFTRVLKVGYRRGDAAHVAILELV